MIDSIHEIWIELRVLTTNQRIEITRIISDYPIWVNTILFTEYVMDRILFLISL